MNFLWKLMNVVAVLGMSGVGADEVFVMVGDSVTLFTGIEANQQKKTRWYFGEIQIAVVIGDEREVCTDVSCKEIFRDRLKLDHQTGSLTIINTRTTDNGVYKRKVINSGSVIDKIFNVFVHVTEQDEMKRKLVKEGESVTLDPGVINTNNTMKWYFNDTLIIEITGDQSKICTDDQCRERFRERLDLQTGSLMIKDTRTTDSGLYKLQINSSSFSISRISSVLTVIALPDSGLSPAAVAGIATTVVVLLIAAAVIIYLKCKARRKETHMRLNDQEKNLEESSPFKTPEADASNGNANGKLVEP